MGFLLRRLAFSLFYFNEICIIFCRQGSRVPHFWLNWNRSCSFHQVKLPLLVPVTMCPWSTPLCSMLGCRYLFLCNFSELCSYGQSHFYGGRTFFHFFVFIFLLGKCSLRTELGLFQPRLFHLGNKGFATLAVAYIDLVGYFSLLQSKVHKTTSISRFLSIHGTFKCSSASVELCFIFLCWKRTPI